MHEFMRTVEYLVFGSNIAYDSESKTFSFAKPGGGLQRRRALDPLFGLQEGARAQHFLDIVGSALSVNEAVPEPGDTQKHLTRMLLCVRILALIMDHRMEPERVTDITEILDGPEKLFWMKELDGNSSVDACSLASTCSKAEKQEP